MARQMGSRDGYLFYNPHSRELARQAKGCPQNYMGVLTAVGPKIVFPIPHSPDLARREAGWVEVLINSIPHELVQVGYRVEMVQDPLVLKV